MATQTRKRLRSQLPEANSDEAPAWFKPYAEKINSISDSADARTAELRETVTANCGIPESVAEKMTLNELEEVAAKAKPKANYSARGGANTDPKGNKEYVPPNVIKLHR